MKGEVEFEPSAVELQLLKETETQRTAQHA